MSIRDLMRADLKQAMKARNRPVIATIRMLIAAIDNAEAVPLSDAKAGSQPTPTTFVRTSPTRPNSDEHNVYIVAATGLNNDIPRKTLTSRDEHRILQREAAERHAILADFQRLGLLDHTQQIEIEIAVIERYLATADEAD